MIWKTTNALGQEVTWYSEDELQELKEALLTFMDLYKQALNRKRFEDE